MTLAFAATALLQAFYFVLIARRLGSSEFGAFAAALAVVAVVAPFVGWGAGNLLVKRTAERSADFGAFFGTGLMAVVLSGGIAWCAIVFAAHVIFGASPVVAVVPWVAGAEIIAARLTDLCVHCFQAQEKVRAAAGTLVAAAAARAAAAAAFALVLAGRDVQSWSHLYLAASVVVAVGAVAQGVRSCGKPTVTVDAARLIARQGIFYAIGSSSQTVYGDIDKTLLSRLTSLDVVGIYTGAYRIIGMAATPVIAFIYAVNPRLFREAGENPQTVRAIVRRASRWAVTYAVVVCGICYFAAPVVPHVLGQSFARSVAALRWLALLPLIQAVHFLYANALMSLGKQALRSGIQVGIAVLNVALNLVLIPAYSWRGAAIATLVSEATLAFCVVLLFNRATGSPGAANRSLDIAGEPA